MKPFAKKQNTGRVILSTKPRTGRDRDGSGAIPTHSRDLPRKGGILAHRRFEVDQCGKEPIK